MKKNVILLFLFAVVAASAQSAFTRVPKEAATPRGNISLTPMVVESQVDSSYIIGPGDFFDLYLENNYFSIQVNADGTLAIDECGIIDVGGKNLNEAKREIIKAISVKYNPQYSTVQISRLKSFIVTIMGAVSQVGQIGIEAQVRLTTLIHRVGGFLPTADQERILLIRGGDSLIINYDKIIHTGDFGGDPVLVQGDKIYVPFVNMDSAVTLVLPDGRVSVPYKEERTIADYYALATGNSIENGGFRFVKFLGKDGKEERMSIPQARVKTVLAGTEIFYDNEVSNKDFVYVGGAVAAMGKVPYNPNFKALDYIAESGVTPITGGWNQVSVVRGNRETLNINATEDEILPGDYIEIPKSRYENFKDFTLFLASLLTVLSSTFIIYMTYK